MRDKFLIELSEILEEEIDISRKLESYEMSDSLSKLSIFDLASQFSEIKLTNNALKSLDTVDDLLVHLKFN